MIQMISGAYGAKDGLKRASDGPFSLSPEEEARLVERKVAKYVDAPVEQEIVPLESLSMAELRAMCKEHGIPFRVGMTKVDMIEAITAKQAEPPAKEDDQNPEIPGTPENPEDTEEDEDPDEEAPTFDPTQAVVE